MREIAGDQEKQSHPKAVTERKEKERRVARVHVLNGPANEYRQKGKAGVKDDAEEERERASGVKVVDARGRG
jgi:hypothetical protein